MDDEQEVAVLRRQLAEQRVIQQKLEAYIDKVLMEFEALEDEIKQLKDEKVWTRANEQLTAGTESGECRERNRQ